MGIADLVFASSYFKVTINTYLFVLQHFVLTPLVKLRSSSVDSMIGILACYDIFFITSFHMKSGS